MKTTDLFKRKGQFSEIVTITPALAEDWLDNRSGRNRAIRNMRVQFLQTEIEDGRWQVTHQGIAFGSDGKLIDGQHRLWAIVLSKKTVRSRVFLNAPKETMDVIDTGHGRTTAEILTISGDMGTVTKNELTVLRAMRDVGKRYMRRSAGHEREYLQKHREAIQFALNILPTSVIRGIINGPVRAVLARAFYSEDRDKIAEFAHVLATGVVTKPEHQPALLLIQFVVRAAAPRARSGITELYYKTERALSLCLSGQPIGKLFASPEELFPLPDESK